MKKTLALGMAAAMTATLLAGCGGAASSARLLFTSYAPHGMQWV